MSASRIAAPGLHQGYELNAPLDAVHFINHVPSEPRPVARMKSGMSASRIAAPGLHPGYELNAPLDAVHFIDHVPSEPRLPVARMQSGVGAPRSAHPGFHPGCEWDDLANGPANAQCLHRLPDPPKA